MASVDIEIAGRRYASPAATARSPHLREVGAIVDEKAHDAAGALGTLSENRQLLLASLLLADELKERRAAVSAGPAPHEDDPAVADALERLAARMESLADRLEGGRANP
jgi:cell division protein ZapA